MRPSFGKVDWTLPVPVQRHRGEPGHTRDRHKNLTNQPQNQPHPQTHAQDHTRTPGRTRRHTHTTTLHSPDLRSSAVVVTVMATAPGRGSSEREPDGIGDGTPPRTGRRGGSKRLRHPRAADRAHGITRRVHARRQYRHRVHRHTGRFVYVNFGS